MCRIRDLRSLPEEELLEAARRGPEGDLRAFDLLVERHKARVVGNCRYLTRSPDDAQDLAQEVFVKAFFGLGSFEGRASFGTWVNRIKVNHCLNFIKKRDRAVHVSLEEPGVKEAKEVRVPPEAEAKTVQGGERDRIREVLDSMPDTLRIPLILRDLDGLSYQEIADTLSVGLSAVKMRIKRGREEFRRKFAKAGSEAERN